MIFHGPCKLTSEAEKNKISSLTNAIRVITHAEIYEGKHAQPPRSPSTHPPATHTYARKQMHIHVLNISTFIFFKLTISLWHLTGFDKVSVQI